MTHTTQVADGCLREQDKVTTVLLGGDETFTVQELGLLSPSPLRTKALFAGQVENTCMALPQLERI
jgi:translation elongation factor EF-4